MAPMQEWERGNDMSPTVLIATTTRWIPTARLAVALTDAGFEVKAVCPPGHPMEQTAVVSEVFTYRGLAPLASFAAAIPRAQPDLIIPGDDLAAQHLHALYASNRDSGEAGEAICDIIEQSLGDPASFAMLYSRASIMELAQKEGIRVPETMVIGNRADLRRWLAVNGFPAVLKSDGSSGGVGVKVTATQEEAERAFQLLSCPPSWLRAAKRAVIDRDSTLVWPTLRRRRPTVNVQTFVGGREATSAVACWKGSVLAALHFEVMATAQSRGHATVVHLIDDPEMSAAAEKLVRKLNLSGLCGFDFMREADSGHAHLIEINPRTTQVGHLALGLGRDLPAALFAAVTGSTVDARPAVTERDAIALFPQEWIRDSASPFLRSAYHDVPWEAPDLVSACAHGYGRQRKWYAPKAVTGDSRKLAPGVTECLTEEPSSSGWAAKQTKTRFP